LAAIAHLHADSWQRHYRGVYSDAYLDGEVFDDRLAVWTERFALRNPDHITIVADDHGTIVGFVHVMLDEDPKWGALVDNLHVAHTHQRLGIGSELMAAAARVVLERTPSAEETQPEATQETEPESTSRGVHLWVLEQNRPAQAFYESRGGACVERASEEAPGGGAIIGLRYVWSDPAALL
jgi:ribosomal protein S18 acetylase RimI-like enzyme